MNFVCCFWFDHVLASAVIALRVPNSAVLFFDLLKNMGRVRTRAPVRKNRVSQRQFRECDLAAAEKRRRKRAQRGTNASRSAKFQDVIEPGIHTDANGRAIL